LAGTGAPAPRSGFALVPRHAGLGRDGRNNQPLFRTVSTRNGAQKILYLSVAGAADFTPGGSPGMNERKSC